VEILDDDSLRLCVDEISAPYAALSYCWGGTQTFTTTTASLDERKLGFSTSDLPKTLREAVTVAHEMGLKYIWIDSLCIIQDSDVDKTLELPKMPVYYGNAYVTISASITESADGSFFEVEGGCDKHPDWDLTNDLVQLKYRAPLPITVRYTQDNSSEDGTSEDPGESTFSLDEPLTGLDEVDEATLHQLDAQLGGLLKTDFIYVREESKYSNVDEPISQRGWTLQERLLSPHILSYGTKLIWYCRSARHCDGGSEDWSFDKLGNELLSISGHSSRAAPPESFIDVFSRNQLYETWHKVVTEYSQRDLTYGSDKLPALSGVTAEFARLSGDTYLAGLWKGNLASELMWTTNPEVDFEPIKDWRAPSWSWASVDLPVTFEKLSNDSRKVCTIIDASVNIKASGNLFGAITSGILVIEAPLVKADPRLLRDVMMEEAQGPIAHETNDDHELERQARNPKRYPSMEKTTFMTTRQELANITDVKAFLESKLTRFTWAPPNDVWCLVLFTRNWCWNRWEKKKESNTWCYSGLVLKRVVGERAGEKYERIGSFHNQKCEWLGGGKMERVSVV